MIHSRFPKNKKYLLNYLKKKLKKIMQELIFYSCSAFKILMKKLKMTLKKKIPIPKCKFKEKLIQP